MNYTPLGPETVWPRGRTPVQQIWVWIQIRFVPFLRDAGHRYPQPRGLDVPGREVAAAGQGPSGQAVCQSILLNSVGNTLTVQWSDNYIVWFFLQYVILFY